MLKIPFTTPSVEKAVKGLFTALDNLKQVKQHFADLAAREEEAATAAQLRATEARAQEARSENIRNNLSRLLDGETAA